MNSAKEAGCAYRGRLLLSASLVETNGEGEQATEGVYLPERQELSRQEKREADPLGPKWRYRAPSQMPSTGRYCLQVAILQGCDLPKRQNLRIRVSWGLPTGKSGFRHADGMGMDVSRDALRNATTSETRRGQLGRATLWNELVCLDDAEWPLDPSQVPDVFIELIDTSEPRRTHFLRYEIQTIGKLGGMVTAQGSVRATWKTMLRDTACTQGVELNCEPREQSAPALCFLPGLSPLNPKVGSCRFVLGLAPSRQCCACRAVTGHRCVQATHRWPSVCCL
jgi:hypothetical protein